MAASPRMPSRKKRRCRGTDRDVLGVADGNGNLLSRQTTLGWKIIKRRQRILLVGPLGGQPWAHSKELIEALDRLGCTVDYQVSLSDHRHISAMPPVDASQPSAKRVQTALVRGKALMVWWRESRDQLRQKNYDAIIVWNENVAAIMALTCWRLADLVWIRSPSSRGLRSRVLRLGLLLRVESVVSEPQDGRSRFASRQRYASYDAPRSPSSEGASHGWALLLGPVRWTEADLAEVVCLADRLGPARYICLDARDALPHVDERVLEVARAAQAPAILTTIDARWVTPLISRTFTLGCSPSDRRVREAHRHLGGAGGPPTQPGDDLASWCRLVLDLPEPLKAHPLGPL